MNDTTSYSYLNQQLTYIINNIDSAIYYLNLFNNTCSQALMINNGTSYKNTIINNKYSLENQRNKIKNEILPEVRTKL